MITLHKVKLPAVCRFYFVNAASFSTKTNLSLFQALCQWRIEKAGGRRVGSGREKGSSSSTAESLEQAIKTSDETKIQMFADWSISHAKLVTTGQ